MRNQHLKVWEVSVRCRPADISPICQLGDGKANPFPHELRRRFDERDMRAQLLVTAALDEI